MCGICGFTGTRDAALLKKMTDILTHRGPDESGCYLGDGIALGHRRLSIIDLNTGRQPIFNEDKSICIVFNGEIYNYLDLRRELETRGHKFYTGTDTEVIIHLYEELAEDCVKRLNGIFAFAIWDNRNKKLLLVRDRLGVKPLYYSCINHQIFFASEIKSILENIAISRKIDLESLDMYLSLRYVPGDKTLIEGIYKLPPAAIMIHMRGERSIVSYWQSKTVEPPGKKAAGEYIEEFRGLMMDAVKSQLVSDVPFGAFISGGIDSAAIVALMSKYCRDKIKTFTIGFNTDIDEFTSARKVSCYFNTEHHEVLLGAKTFELLPEIVWHLDEPIGDAIVIPTYLLAQQAAESVKMILTGEGADEIFGSYIHQVTMHFSKVYERHSNKFIRKLLKEIIRFTPHSLLNHFFSYPASLGMTGKGRLLDYLGYLGDNKEQYSNLASVFSEQDKTSLYSAGFQDKLDENKLNRKDFREILDGEEDNALLNRLIDLDIRYWLADYTLCKLDSLTMGNSLEARVPFLDHRIVEFCAKIPVKLKLNGFTTKYLLRQSMEGILPRQVIKAPKKAFYFPVEKCFGKEFKGYITELLNEETIAKRGLFNYGYIKDLLKAYEAPELLKNKQLMSLVILENWMKAFID